MAGLQRDRVLGQDAQGPALGGAGREPLAVLFSSLRATGGHGAAPGPAREDLVTADLAGAAWALVEEEYGDGAVALFFMGAAGDQSPCTGRSQGPLRGYGGPSAGEEVGDAATRSRSMGARLGAEVDAYRRGDPDCRHIIRRRSSPGRSEASFPAKDDQRHPPAHGRRSSMTSSLGRIAVSRSWSSGWAT